MFPASISISVPNGVTTENRRQAFPLIKKSLEGYLALQEEKATNWLSGCLWRKGRWSRSAQVAEIHSPVKIKK